MDTKQMFDLQRTRYANDSENAATFLTNLKWLLKAASIDGARPVLQALHIFTEPTKPDDSILETSDDFRVHRLHYAINQLPTNPETGEILTDLVKPGLYMVKITGKIATYTAPEDLQSSRFPDTTAICPRYSTIPYPQDGLQAFTIEIDDLIAAGNTDVADISKRLNYFLGNRGRVEAPNFAINSTYLSDAASIFADYGGAHLMHYGKSNITCVVANYDDPYKHHAVIMGMHLGDNNGLDKFCEF